MSGGKLHGFTPFNLGNERGTTVLEVIASAAAALGRPIPHVFGSRRAGDPPMLVGSSARIRGELGWRPQHSDIDTIVRTAAAWLQAHPQGYADGGR